MPKWKRGPCGRKLLQEQEERTKGKKKKGRRKSDLGAGKDEEMFCEGVGKVDGGPWRADGR